jgi:uncharacterized coiled-coil protein SlyX
MSKFNLIKERLASLLEEVEVKMSTVKTNKAVLEYDGDLKEGIDVFVSDAETEERTPAADGEYVTEDNKVITIEGGKIVSIVEKEEEKPIEDEKPVEEPAKEEAEEETKEEETPIEEPQEEPKEEEVEPSELEKKIADLEEKVAELQKALEDMQKSIEEKFSMIEKMSAASPVAEEFEKTKTAKKTGNSKVDRFIERYGDK